MLSTYLNKDLLKPITDISNCGEDLRYSDEFNELLKNFNRISDVDSLKILSESCKLLSTRSKDLSLMGLIVYSCMYKFGYLGLYEGLSYYLRIFREYKTNIFPLKAKSKIKSFALFESEKFLNYFHNNKRIDLQLRESIKNVLQDIIELSSESCGENVSNFDKLLRALNTLNECNDEKNDNQQNNEITSSKLPIIPSKSYETSISSEADLKNVVNEVCLYLRKNNSNAVISMVLNRAIRWLSIKEYPKVVNDKTSFIPAPRNEIKNNLIRLFTQKNYNELLEYCEQVFMESGNHLYFDIQYYVYDSMINLNYKLSDIETVFSPLKNIITKFPNLLEYKFKDSTPFVESKTIEWINTFFKLENNEETSLMHDDCNENLLKIIKGSDYKVTNAILNIARTENNLDLALLEERNSILQLLINKFNIVNLSFIQKKFDVTACYLSDIMNTLKTECLVFDDCSFSKNVIEFIFKFVKDRHEYLNMFNLTELNVLVSKLDARIKMNENE